MCATLHIELLLNQRQDNIGETLRNGQFVFLSIMEKSANSSLFFVFLCHFFKILSYVVLLFLSVPTLYTPISLSGSESLTILMLCAPVIQIS